MTRSVDQQAILDTRYVLHDIFHNVDKVVRRCRIFFQTVCVGGPDIFNLNFNYVVGHSLTNTMNESANAS